MRSRYCKTCGEWHDLDEPWPRSCYSKHKVTGGLQIIKDIEPYQAMGADVASGGRAPRITSRTRHRQYLNDNGYVEVGNEPIHKPEVFEPPSAARDIQRTIHEMKASGRWK